MPYQTSSLILELFDVSRETADVEARDVLDFLVAKGGESSDWTIVHRYVTRYLGERLPWRSEALRLKFQTERDATIAAYNHCIDHKR